VDRGEQRDPTPKSDLYPKKVMLSVWWDFQGVVYFELLPTNTTITAEAYCIQLQKLRDALRNKRPGRGKVCLLHDNARPHIAKIIRDTLAHFRWEVLPHPPYSPDLAPSDFHLFRSLSNHLRGERFDDRDQLEIYLSHFFESKSRKLYEDGITDLPHR
jgi:histone-lysine N-methyltransferase SETMAR